MIKPFCEKYGILLKMQFFVNVSRKIFCGQGGRQGRKEEEKAGRKVEVEIEGLIGGDAICQVMVSNVDSVGPVVLWSMAVL